MPKSEQGISFERYMVIPRCLIFITRGDEVLMLKGAANKRIWANKYNGIGGHLERGEDPKTAALRELKEEAGLEGIDLWLCGISMVDADERVGIAIYMFKGEHTGQMIQSSSEGGLEWLKMDRLNQYPLVEDLYVVLPEVLKMRRGTEPLCMRYTYDAAERLQVHFA